MRLVERLRTSSRADVAVACLAIAASGAHDAVHVRAGNWPQVFWLCDVSAALVGPALLLRSPYLVTATFTWLIPGTTIWLLDAWKNGSEIMPTSWGIHVGALIASAFAVRRVGSTPNAWRASAALLASVVVFSRLCLPASANINVAHSTPAGWAFLGPNRWVFAATVLTLAAVMMWLGQKLALALAPGRESVARDESTHGSRADAQ